MDGLGEPPMINGFGSPRPPEFCAQIFYFIAYLERYAAEKITKRNEFQLPARPISAKLKTPTCSGTFFRPGLSGPGFPTIFFAYNCSFLSYLSLGSMLDRFGLKNKADCTSQCLKRSSGARVMTFLCPTNNSYAPR